MTYQIMTAENIIKGTEKTSWDGSITGQYNPDYETLIANSECEEEADEWRKCRDFSEKMHIGFAFEFVTCMKGADGKYHILQHPKYMAETEEGFQQAIEEGQKYRSIKF